MTITNDEVFRVTRVERDDFDWIAKARRKLPHWTKRGQTYFVTCEIYEIHGFLLKDPRLAKIVYDTIMFGVDERYLLHAYVIMSNHIHLVFTPLEGWTLAKIMHGIKGFSAKGINKAMGMTGRVWRSESWDHLIRNHENFCKYVDYIHENPVVAGMVPSAEDYYYSSAWAWQQQDAAGVPPVPGS